MIQNGYVCLLMVRCKYEFSMGKNGYVCWLRVICLCELNM